MFIEEWVYQQLLREEERRLLYNPPPVVSVPFYKVQSEIFERTEQELLVYNMPITEILVDNSVKELQQFLDERYINTTVDRYIRSK